MLKSKFKLLCLYIYIYIYMKVDLKQSHKTYKAILEHNLFITWKDLKHEIRWIKYGARLYFKLVWSEQKSIGETLFLFIHVEETSFKIIKFSMNDELNYTNYHILDLIKKTIIHVLWHVLGWLQNVTCDNDKYYNCTNTFSIINIWLHWVMK